MSDDLLPAWYAALAMYPELHVEELTWDAELQMMVRLRFRNVSVGRTFVLCHQPRNGTHADTVGIVGYYDVVRPVSWCGDRVVGDRVGNIQIKLPPREIVKHLAGFGAR